MSDYFENIEQNNERLTNIFSKVGKEYKYDTVQAEFMNFTEVKVRWQRGYGWLNLQIPDYMVDAPDEVLGGLARAIFERLTGSKGDYPKEVLAWFTSPEFSKEKSRIYMSRNPQYLNTVEGKTKNLNDSYKRLADAGLIPYDPTITLTWEMEGSQKMAHCSVLMRVVAVSERLDKDDVPDSILDYCLYHELCHILVGYYPDNDMHEDAFYEYEDKYPDKAEAVRWLRGHSIYV